MMYCTLTPLSLGWVGVRGHWQKQGWVWEGAGPVCCFGLRIRRSALDLQA